MEGRALVQALRGLRHAVVKAGKKGQEEWYHEVVDTLLARVDNLIVHKQNIPGLGLLGLSSILRDLGEMGHSPQDPFILNRLAISFVDRLDGVTSAGLPSEHRLVNQGTISKSVGAALYGLVSLRWWPSLDIARPFFHKLKASLETTPATIARRTTIPLQEEEEEEKVEDLWDRAGLGAVVDKKREEGDGKAGRAASSGEGKIGISDISDVWMRAGLVGEEEGEDEQRQSEGLTHFFRPRNTLFSSMAPGMATTQTPQEVQQLISPSLAPIPFLQRMEVESLVRSLWSLCVFHALVPPNADPDKDLALVPLLRSVQLQLGRRLVTGSKSDLKPQGRSLLLQALAFIEGYHQPKVGEDAEEEKREALDVLRRGVSARVNIGGLETPPSPSEVGRIISLLTTDLRLDPNLLLPSPMMTSKDTGCIGLDLALRLSTSRVLALELDVPSRYLWGRAGSSSKKSLRGEVAFRRCLLGVNRGAIKEVTLAEGGDAAVVTIINAYSKTQTLVKQLAGLLKQERGRARKSHSHDIAVAKWEKMTVLQLKELLREQGKGTSGNKAQLIERVLQGSKD